MQNAIKLENISNLITSPSSYQCRKTMLVHFVIHINGMYVCALGIPKGKFSKQMKKNTRTCARWRSFMHIYFRYGFDLVFIVYVFMVHWKNKCAKMCHICRKRIHKWHQTKTKYNQMFMIIEMIEESLGWRTSIHRGYINKLRKKCVYSYNTYWDMSMCCMFQQLFLNRLLYSFSLHTAEWG
jgi:hypothetical protein